VSAPDSLFRSPGLAASGHRFAPGCRKPARAPRPQHAGMRPCERRSPNPWPGARQRARQDAQIGPGEARRPPREATVPCGWDSWTAVPGSVWSVAAAPRRSAGMGS